MVNDLALRSQYPSLANNRLQEFQSSTMTSNPSSKSPSVSIPVPRLIDYRFVHITPVSENPPNFEWLAFQRVSNYIVQLSDSKGIVWRDTIHSTKEDTVTYCNETFLEPGKDYIFTVEIDRQYSCSDSCNKKEANIAKDVKNSIKKIKDTGLPRQFITNIITQLDGLLIAREEILDIIRRAILQGSNSEIICFMDNVLSQGSAFELLTKARSCDDVLDLLAQIASQLAAANITLGKYLKLSGVQKSLAESLVSKAVELAFFSQNLEGAFQFGQFANVKASNNCEQPFCSDLGDFMCSEYFSDRCGGCKECQEQN